MSRMMCRIAALAATAGLMAPGANAAPSAPIPAPARAAAPVATSAATPAKPAAKTPAKADAAARAAAARLSPLDRITFWNSQVQIDPRDSAANLALAQSLRAVGRYEPALNAVASVLILDAHSQEGLLEEARIYLAAGQGFYAIEPARMAAAAAPGDWRPVSLLAVAYEQAQRDDEALLAYQQAVAMAPNSAAPTANLAMYLAGIGDRAQAENLLRKAVTMKDAQIQERQNLALVLGLEGKLDEAEKLMRADLPPEEVAANLAMLRASAPGAAEAAAKPAPARTYKSLQAGG